MAMVGRQIQRLALGRPLRPSLFAPALSLAHQQRGASTQTVSDEEALRALNKARNARPISPHFTIYQPQLTWYSSIANRVTGCALSGGMYAFFLGYLAAPSLGFSLDSETLVSAFAATPEWFKVASKGLVALPFTYHSFNGLRHLSWDMGWFMELKSSYIAGYTVLGATAVSTLALALM